MVGSPKLDLPLTLNTWLRRKLLFVSDIFAELIENRFWNCWRRPTDEKATNGRRGEDFRRRATG
jgi:hypothetical protein